MPGTPKLFDRITPENSEPSSPELFEEEDLTISIPMPIDVAEKENQSAQANQDQPVELSPEEQEKKAMKEEFEETRHFYRRLKGYNQYDLTLSNFKYWKGEPYVGKYYREFIEKSSKMMVLTALINERLQINDFDKLRKTKSNQASNGHQEKSIYKGLLKYVKKQDVPYFVKSKEDYLNQSVDYLNWRFKSHLYRFGFIKKFLKSTFELESDNFKTYNDVLNYFGLK